ncbi:MAG TPA: hypothetical protein VHI50_07490, partial [Micromonosporaceae bacterium]|nr:hypothetical protein [Micromonosporaceae bacterium]
MALAHGNEGVGDVGGSDLLEAEPPAFSTAEVRRLLGESYGLAVADLRPLDSERDQMFLVADRAAGPAVLKISNSAESPDTLDMENGAMRHL